ncbi:pseudouridine synthase [uncultured Pseudoflavonifractor sp.]|uniref:pseudouridine synthase n=1 Tax=uncultured Pseudoflavonifractor sp. TaxID=1221379 RepID=UPI0025DC7E20|nr:pseudouridine synthase [uncultured Pseudoflavonifractor sp.]
MEERIQKILSAAGLASRRRAEEYLTAGRVTVNGRTAMLGEKADPERDDIQLDGKTVRPVSTYTYLMLYKPRGYVTTLSDERGRRTVAQLVSGCGARVWPVGRLDLDSEGLLLMTDDGDFTQRMIHPSHQVEKEYLVTVSGDVDSALPVLSSPMKLDGVPLSAAKVSVLSREGDNRARLSVVIHEGRNRQVRRMCALAGLEVKRLKRVREGGLVLRGLRPGAWRLLTEEEIRLALQEEQHAGCTGKDS